jgi:hypothetical protein
MSGVRARARVPTKETRIRRNGAPVDGGLHERCVAVVRGMIHVSPCGCEHPDGVEGAVQRGSHQGRAAVRINGVDVCAEVYEVLYDLRVSEIGLRRPQAMSAC